MSLTPDELGQQIREAQQKQGKPPADLRIPADNKVSGARQALRAATDFSAAIFVSGVLGYWLDKWLNTGNILMIIGVVVGSVAGFIGLLKSLNVITFNKNNDGSKRKQ